MDFSFDPLLVDCRLITYGGLKRGGSVHYQIERLNGVWANGTVRGRVSNDHWTGFPALRLDPKGQENMVEILFSYDLPSFWPVLDAYESYGYKRVIATAETCQGNCIGWVYISTLSGICD